MRKLDDGDGLRPAHVGDLVAEFQIDVDYLDRGNIDRAEWELLTNQYAYIKFGLILEKIRNQSWWQKCSEKFSDFRQFCESKVNLNIWQVLNAIKSARVAVTLAQFGFTELPRNASQALKMAGLSADRLGEVWGKILNICKGHKITALIIEQQVNPDHQTTHTNLRVPTDVIEALTGQAAAAGMTLSEYLRELAFLDSEDESIEVGVENEIEITSEMSALVDRVEYQWLKPAMNPKQFLEQSIESFDRIMTDLVGSFVPRPRKNYA
jgi:hypothetical protein